MHELFIAAAIPKEKVRGILMILQGLCAMTPERQLEWRLLFEGPRTVPLSGIPPAQQATRKAPNQLLWKELQVQLTRQSYYLAVSYDVDESYFGPAISGAKTSPGIGEFHTKDASGTLHFLDFPDPPGTRTVNSRLVVHIKDELNLPPFLQNSGYNYSSQSIRESHVAYRDNVIFCMSRELQIPKEFSQNGPVLPNSLPPCPDLSPFDPEDKWVLTASVEVADGNNPTFVQRGTDQLAQVKQDLGGICDFEITDRQKLDTRVPLRR